MGFLSTDLSEKLARRFKGRGLAKLAKSAKPDDTTKVARTWEQAKIWIVFAFCFICSLLGVVLSFTLFGSTITGTRKWGLAVVVSFIMLGLSYGAKYSNIEARSIFTPVDALHYGSQGILWPSTWPALADLIGIQRITGPAKAALIRALEHLDASSTLLG